MVDPFPPIALRNERFNDEDGNPAIQLFGRRFFADQSIPEYLVELLLVASSKKRVGDVHFSKKEVFPGLNVLQTWPNGTFLEYAPKARLNLKLFAFLGASKLETRHETHRQHYGELLKQLQAEAQLRVTGTTHSLDVLRTLENLFLGFQGVGGQRTWCAQSFLPVVTELVTAESIWKQSQARKRLANSWEQSLKYFSQSQHLFLARGGELLFLQLCNALRQDPTVVDGWFRRAGFSLSENERDPRILHERLGRAIQDIFLECPETVGKLAEFIDTAADRETANNTDIDPADGSPRFTKCGWCPEESWPEGYLFAVELLRLCQAELDPLDRIELMITACAMQVLRSLCAQSARYVNGQNDKSRNAGPLGFLWAISDPEGRHSVVKKISQRNVKAIERMLYDAIRHPELLTIVEGQRRRDEVAGSPWKDPLRPYVGANGADSRYGHKLFLGLGKRIGFIVPKRGPGARFVLNDKLLRFLVMAVVRPGERITYDTFKNLVFAHYGLVLDDVRLGDACEWCGTNRLTTLGGGADAWVSRMLDAAGMLIRLSDAFSLVVNPFGGGEE